MDIIKICALTILQENKMSGYEGTGHYDAAETNHAPVEQPLQKSNFPQNTVRLIADTFNRFKQSGKQLITKNFGSDDDNKVHFKYYNDRNNYIYKHKNLKTYTDRQKIKGGDMIL
jgi:hypothetical protein